MAIIATAVTFLLRHYKVNPIPQYSQSSKKYEAVQQEKENNLPAAITADTNNNTREEQLLTNEHKKKEPLNNTSNPLRTQHLETVAAKMQPGNSLRVNRTDNRIIKKQHLTNKLRVNANQTNRRSTAAVITQKNKRYSQSNESVSLSSGSNTIKDKYSLLSGKNDNEKVIEKLMNAKNAGEVKQVGTYTTNTDLTDSATQIIASKKPTDSLALSKVNRAIENSNNKAAEKTDQNKSKTQPSFYIGIIAGPDISTVKSTEIGGPGYNLGFITGYRTGKHLAFETGIIWNNKRYHAEGKHVSVNKLGLDSHYDLLYLNGTCGMIEIPLSVRYHFTAKAKNNWYVGAGLSSYIMRKEAYNYKSIRYNMEYYRKKEYVNASKNWLSVLQLNVGYEINFKNRGSLRFEPYAKLPLKGIGIGELPLSSTGINIGFTMPIH